MTVWQLGFIVCLSIGIGVLLAQLVAMRPTKPSIGKHAASRTRPAWPVDEPPSESEPLHGGRPTTHLPLLGEQFAEELASPVRGYVRRRQA